jgi:hypothetical protein
VVTSGLLTELGGLVTSSFHTAFPVTLSLRLCLDTGTAIWIELAVVHLMGQGLSLLKEIPTLNPLKLALDEGIDRRSWHFVLFCPCSVGTLR